MNGQKDIIKKESTIIQACRMPSVIEIQEVSMIEKPGTLTRLNALFDDCAKTDLLNGEIIERHPDTVVILTTNLDYVGCQMFNESVLSRMNLIQHRKGMSAKDMAKRAAERTGCKEFEIVQEMAQVVANIHQYFTKKQVQGGVCGNGALIKSLSENAGRRVCLGKKQEKELWDHAEVISAGLGEVLKRIPSEETGSFLKQWLDNGALVYDLNRLKHLLSEMPPDQELAFMKNRISYLNFLYGNILEGVDMMRLSGEQNSLLVYGITHKKKHFLSVVKENFRGTFCWTRIRMSGF